MTQKEVDQALPGQTINDKDSPGFVRGLQLRAFPTKKCYYLFYRLHGTQYRPKVGDASLMTLDQARAAARTMLAEATLGAQRRRDLMTVEALFRLVWEKHWSAPKFQKSGHAKEVKRNYELHIAPAFGKKLLPEVNAARIREWLATFSENIYAGNRSLEVLSTMFRFAEMEEIRDQNTNPCKLVRAFTERRRDVYATEDQIKAVGAILRREEAEHPAPVAFIYLLIFSGSRPSGIERATWAQLEHRRSFGILTIDGKTGPEKIYLPEHAMTVINKLPRDTETICGISFPRKFWERVRTEAGCPNLWARDWRRTFATIALSQGNDMGVISELLNHASTQTTKIYAKLDDSKREAVATETAARLNALLTAP